MSDVLSSSERLPLRAAALFSGPFDRTRLTLTADWLAALVAASLPWSTSATAIIIVLWLLATLPTLQTTAMRRELLTAAGALPVLLWCLAAVAMLWADTSWAERLEGLGGFHKLLFVPLLLAQFRRSEHGWWVIFALFGSAVVLLVVSLGLVLLPGLPWRGKQLGVPVKDYILQSGLFALCAFGAVGFAFDAWRTHRRALAAALALIAAAMIADIAYVATARTALLVLAVLALLLGFRQFGWKGMVGAGALGIIIGGVLWTSSPYLRERVVHAVQEVQAYRTADEATSAGLRLEYWKRSMEFLGEAPLLGQGTGMIPTLFRQSAQGETGSAAWTTFNPHNQILAIAVQLGLVGVLLLFAMWFAHLALFRGGGLVGWCGLLVVVQNIVSSLFNSHLFDFSQGWLYVFGVGVIGGLALRQQDATRTLLPPPPEPR